MKNKNRDRRKKFEMRKNREIDVGEWKRKTEMRKKKGRHALVREKLRLEKKRGADMGERKEISEKK